MIARKRDLYTYTVELIPTEPEGYSVYVPAVPGVVTDGGTLEEALAMARDAVTLHLEGLREDGIEIPVESHRRRRRTVRIAIEIAT